MGEQAAYVAQIQQFQIEARKYLARKGAGNSEEQQERTPRWYRQKSFEWLAHTHNQIEWMTGFPEFASAWREKR